MDAKKIVSILIAVVIFVTLLPIIANTISGGSFANLSATSKLLLGLVPLMVVIGFVIAVIKMAGAK